MRPFNVAFTRNEYGHVLLTGEQPVVVAERSAFPSYEDNDELLSELVHLPQFNGRERFKLSEGYERGYPITRLSEFVSAAKAGALSENPTDYSGDVQLEIDDVERFAVELLRLVLTTRTQPRYGKENWWLDYVSTD